MLLSRIIQLNQEVQEFGSMFAPSSSDATLLLCQILFLPPAFLLLLTQV